MYYSNMFGIYFAVHLYTYSIGTFKFFEIQILTINEENKCTFKRSSLTGSIHECAMVCLFDCKIGIPQI